MTVGTIGWLKSIMENFSDDTGILLAIGDKLYPLAGKVDKVIITYANKEDPEITMGKETMCLYPHIPIPPTPKPDIVNPN